jgi:hypothetical protein
MGKSHTNKDCLLFFHCNLKQVLHFIYASPHISGVSQMIRQTTGVIAPLQNKEKT